MLHVVTLLEAGSRNRRESHIREIKWILISHHLAHSWLSMSTATGLSCGHCGSNTVRLSFSSAILVECSAVSRLLNWPPITLISA